MIAFEKILIIDDDPIHNMVSSKIIENSGFAKKTDKILSGKKALEYIEECLEKDVNAMPDLIFLDINMPLMSGWEFIDIYEQMIPKINKNIPIYVLTSSISPNDMEKAETCEHVYGFVTKPLSTDKLTKINNELNS